MVSEEEKIYIEAAKKLVELARINLPLMVSEFEVRDAAGFLLNASHFFGGLARARLLCDLVSPENERKCLVPVMKAEEEALAKLKEALTK